MTKRKFQLIVQYSSLISAVIAFGLLAVGQSPAPGTCVPDSGGELGASCIKWRIQMGQYHFHLTMLGVFSIILAVVPGTSTGHFFGLERIVRYCSRWYSSLPENGDKDNEHKVMEE